MYGSRRFSTPSPSSTSPGKGRWPYGHLSRSPSPVDRGSPTSQLNSTANDLEIPAVLPRSSFRPSYSLNDAPGPIRRSRRARPTMFGPPYQQRNDSTRDSASVQAKSLTLEAFDEVSLRPQLSATDPTRPPESRPTSPDSPCSLGNVQVFEYTQTELSSEDRPSDLQAARLRKQESLS